jgi:DNA (cytosine-5)-methyltransferase 1
VKTTLDVKQVRHEPMGARTRVADQICELAAAFHFNPRKSKGRQDSEYRALHWKSVRRMLERLNLDSELYAERLNGERDALQAHARNICTETPRCTECPFVSFCKTGQDRVATEKGPIIIDLFAGAGGLGRGFRNAGFRIGLAVEVDADAAQTYRLNNPGTPVLESDIACVTARTISGIVRAKPAVVCAGPPCQSFSAAGLRNRRDERHGLFRYVLDIAHDLDPEVVLIENVPGIARILKNRQSYKDIIAEELGQRFKVEVLLLNAVDYGVPQMRKRYIFLGRKRGSSEIGVPAKTHTTDPISNLPSTPTVRDVLWGLPRYPQGWKRDWHQGKDGTIIRNLTTMTHSDRVVSKIRRIRGGEGPISYRRVPGNYAKTLISGHRALPVHPDLHRTISAREAACIQGFPRDFIFLGSPSNQPLQVANAVPPPLAEAVARQILAHLKVRGRP